VSALSAQQLSDENRHLQRAVEELSMLNDLAGMIGASHDADSVMQTIIRQSLQAVNGEQGIVTLIDRDAEHSFKTLVRTMAYSHQGAAFHLHDVVVGWMCLNKLPLLMNDPGNDPRFPLASWPETVRHILCVPLMIKSEITGVLTVYNKKRGPGFSPDDQRILSIIATQSAQVIENARLFEQERVLLAMQKELSIAAKIQADLLPTRAPSVEGYDIAAVTHPALSVGGDYFDFITCQDPRLGLCVADVTGKGMPAALLMANVQATLRGQVLADPAPAACLGRANTLLYNSTDSDRFVTLFYGLLDPRDHTLRYCNAGHDRPLLFDESMAHRELATGGVMLGIMPSFPYEEESIHIPPGFMLVAYSDGVTEARNPEGEHYELDRLLEAIREHRALSAAELIEKVVREVQSFTAGAQQSDDITLMVAKRVL
jgi:phosphoserine phosphatase RsbU/P